MRKKKINYESLCGAVVVLLMIISGAALVYRFRYIDNLIVFGLSCVATWASVQQFGESNRMKKLLGLDEFVRFAIHEQYVSFRYADELLIEHADILSETDLFIRYLENLQYNVEKKHEQLDLYLYAGKWDSNDEKSKQDKEFCKKLLDMYALWNTLLKQRIDFAQKVYSSCKNKSLTEITAEDWFIAFCHQDQSDKSTLAKSISELSALQRKS